MASTSTNKQPLLVDRVLHEIVDLAGRSVAQNAGIEIIGTNSAVLVLDCTTNDGAIVEDVYAIARQIATGYKINLYISTGSDYLRTQQSEYIATLTGGITSGQKTRISTDELPLVLAPMPHAGTTSQFTALYIPRGKALWAAVEEQSSGDQTVAAPLIGVQGGYY